MGCAIGVLALACATHGVAAELQPSEAPLPTQPVDRQTAVSEPTDVEAIEVVALKYGFQPVDVKKDSPYIVDSVTYDDIEAPTGDNSIASMVVQVPGVSWESDGDEPRYITIRGLSADLNSTTLDGLTLATIGENGSGTRRVNLQLIPSDVADRVDVFKAFTAEQETAAIGGLTDIISRSAFSQSGRYFMADVYGIYSTFDGPAGENAAGNSRDHWGGGFKTAFSDTFGSDEQFGLVFTARYQDRARNSNKNWPDQRVFFNTAGAVIPNPDPALGWDGGQAQGKFAFGDFNNYITNLGASLKLEWQPRQDVTGFAMAYWYNRREDSTMNSTDIIADNNAITDRTQDGGTARVNYVQSVTRYNQWSRTASGLITGFDWDRDEKSSLSVRAGVTRETYDDDEYWARVRTSANNLSYTYTYDGDLPRLTGMIGDQFASTYLLNGANINFNEAFEDVFEVRADYGYNVNPSSLGFGFKAGVKATHLELKKDMNTVRYVTGGNVDALMYNPNYEHHLSGVVMPWLNYDRFWNQGGTPPIHAGDTARYNVLSDYAYTEDVLAGYLSLHYRTEQTHIIAGLRYDDVSFDGRSPLTVDGVLTDEWARPSGGYSNWLPSFNLVHDFNESWKFRASVSRTIGRPTPGHIVQAETQNCGEDVTGCTISRGNPDLKPRRATNFDLALEHYFDGGDALVALTAFRKEIKDDIFTLTTDVEENGVINRYRQPLNAETSEVEGIELAVVDRAFWFHENLGASFNVTALSGKMNYTTDTLQREVGRLVSQPDWMANLTVTYRIPKIDGTMRVSVNAQDHYMTSIGANEWADKFMHGRTTVDLSFWHRVKEDFIFKYEIDNVFDVKPEMFHGRDQNGTISQRDHYGQGFYFHIIYSPQR